MRSTFLFGPPQRGGTLEVGEIVEGWQNIFLAQLADPNTVKFFYNIALYNSGRYFHMLFGLPAVCLAMYTTIPDSNRKKATIGFLVSIGLNLCFVTGVTEPISFALLFRLPFLFVAERLFCSRVPFRGRVSEYHNRFYLLSRNY